MASREGICSPFLKQPSTRSPKLRIYESLFLLNQGFDHVVALLRGMEKFSIADKESMRSTLAEIEEVRAGVNADFTEHLADSERFDEGRFWKQRRAIEKKWQDPDDLYIDVSRREEERKTQGLAPRIGVVPHSAVPKQEQHLEAQQDKNQRARKRSNAKHRAGGRS